MGKKVVGLKKFAPKNVAAMSALDAAFDEPDGDIKVTVTVKLNDTSVTIPSDVDEDSPEGYVRLAASVLEGTKAVKKGKFDNGASKSRNKTVDNTKGAILVALIANIDINDIVEWGEEGETTEGKVNAELGVPTPAPVNRVESHLNGANGNGKKAKTTK